MSNEKYEVEAIINERSRDGKHEYLVRWAGNYMPSWQPADIIEKDCPDLVQDFQDTPPLTRVLKCALAPSSAKLGWDTVLQLLGMNTFQSKWNPVPKNRPLRGSCGSLPPFDQFTQYWEFVDEMYDEAGKLPLLAMLLSGALHVYPRRGVNSFAILPQARRMREAEYKCDYAIAIAEKTDMKYIILFEVKKTVSPNLHATKAKYIAQTLVEGYYAMLGSRCQLEQTSIIVALTSIDTTHFFKIKPPTTRSGDRHMEIVWHHLVVINEYPPKTVGELVPFIEFIHELLDEEK